MSVQNEASDQRQAAVYRLYGAGGVLLYIGSAYDPESRFKAHRSKPWWPLVARRAIEWHPSKGAAYAAEMAAIAAENPTHNEMGTPWYVSPAAKSVARRGPRPGELSIAEIMAKHRVSRQSLHTYRQLPGFPKPLREGTSRLRWLESEVAAWFDANPKQQGKKRDQFVSHQRGESRMTYILTMRIEADSEVTPEQIREEIYEACPDVPFGFDITSIEPEASDG